MTELGTNNASISPATALHIASDTRSWFFGSFIIYVGAEAFLYHWWMNAPRDHLCADDSLSNLTMLDAKTSHSHGPSIMHGPKRRQLLLRSASLTLIRSVPRVGASLNATGPSDQNLASQTLPQCSTQAPAQARTLDSPDLTIHLKCCSHIN